MSTTVSSPSPSLASATASASSTPASSPTLTSSASLYLYTFLATLVLLLSVSAAIVIRSYILRRRQRRLFEEAFQDGTIMPPPRRFRTPAEKPVLHDAYLSFDHLYRAVTTAGESSRMTDWPWLMPVSAVRVAREQRGTSEPNPTQNAPSSSPVSIWRRFYPRANPAAWTPPSQAAAPSPPAVDTLPMSSLEPSTAHTPLANAQQARVVFLVAMPDRHESSEGYLPPVEFGIADVPIRAEPETN